MVMETPVPGSDAVALIKLVFQAADSMASATSDVLAELELTQSQARILWALDPSRPPVPMRQLARRLHFDPSNITLMTDRLAAVGLVERRPVEQSAEVIVRLATIGTDGPTGTFQVDAGEFRW
jgi:MarR family transcriptional regulator, organic hydroperoxide resistance regulator